MTRRAGSVKAAPMEAFLACWFASAVVCAAWVGRDAVRAQPEIARAMKVAWTLTALFLGPIGLSLYLATGREPRSGARQAVGSTVHLAAAAVLGTVAASVVTAPLALPAWGEVAIELTAALAIGALLARPAAIVPLAALVLGIGPAAHMLRGAAGPGTLGFWGAIAAAVGVGFVFAYPWSWLLAGRRLTPIALRRSETGALTRREREVTALAAGGRSNAEIAALLEISVRTVESHLYHAMVKLGVGRRGELPDEQPSTEIAGSQ
jgi:DNA-binding CsgD family transcriptional regulator